MLVRAQGASRLGGRRSLWHAGSDRGIRVGKFRKLRTGIDRGRSEHSKVRRAQGFTGNGATARAATCLRMNSPNPVPIRIHIYAAAQRSESRRRSLRERVHASQMVFSVAFKDKAWPAGIAAAQCRFFVVAQTAATPHVGVRPFPV